MTEITAASASRESSSENKQCPICGKKISEGAVKCSECDGFVRFWHWRVFLRAFWKLVELAIIPITIVVLAYLLANLQAERQNEIDKKRAQSDLLQAYLTDVSLLYLERDVTDEKIQSALRARTLPVMSELDWKGNKTITRFLDESDMNQWLYDGADMRNFDLKEAYLNDANFFGTNLKDADLTGAHMIGAILINTTLTDTLMSGVNLSEASLSMINLSGKDFSGAVFSGAQLDHVNLSSANLQNAHLMDMALGEEVNMSNADLSGAMFGGDRAIGLHLVDFSGAIFRDAILAGLENLNLSGLDLTGAELDRGYGWFDPILRDAILRDADLSGTVFNGPADFSGADLSGANLNHAGLGEVIFSDTTKLSGATYTPDTIWPYGFDPKAAGAVLVFE